MDIKLLSLGEAARFLGVSVPTFYKLIKNHNIQGVKIGARIKYTEEELLRAIDIKRTEDKPKKNSATIFDETSISDIEIQKNVFDLGKLKKIDPYGVTAIVSILACLVKNDLSSEIVLKDNLLVPELYSMGFFNELDRLDSESNLIKWDKNVLNRILTKTLSVISPIHIVRKGEERILIETLSDLMQYGFSKDMGGYVTWILGELTDNTLLHSSEALGDRFCYTLVKREQVGINQDCIILAVSDIGLGIHNTLKSNKKFANLSNLEALITAFKGKGLSDVLKIVMGNKSYLRIDSNEYSLVMDFRNKKEQAIRITKPFSDKITGTRFGIMLIDDEFNIPEDRSIPDAFIDDQLEKLRRKGVI